LVDRVLFDESDWRQPIIQLPDEAIDCVTSATSVDEHVQIGETHTTSHGYDIMAAAAPPKHRRRRGVSIDVLCAPSVEVVIPKRFVAGSPSMPSTAADTRVAQFAAACASGDKSTATYVEFYAWCFFNSDADVADNFAALQKARIIELYGACVPRELVHALAQHSSQQHIDAAKMVWPDAMHGSPRFDLTVAYLAFQKIQVLTLSQWAVVCGFDEPSPRAIECVMNKVGKVSPLAVIRDFDTLLIKSCAGRLYCFCICKCQLQLELQYAPRSPCRCITVPGDEGA